MEQMILTGRLTADPELRNVTVNGVETKVVNFFLAENVSKEKVKFFRLTAWRNAAENLAKFGKKGRHLTCLCNNVDINIYEVNDEIRGNITADIVSFEFNDSKPADDISKPIVKAGGKKIQQSSVMVKPAVDDVDADDIPM